MGGFGNVPDFTGTFSSQLGNGSWDLPPDPAWNPGSGIPALSTPAMPANPQGAEPAPVDARQQKISDQIETSNALSVASTIMAIGGALSSAIGAFYSAKSAKNQLKAQESALNYQREIANINSRLAEAHAQMVTMSGQRQIGAMTARYGQARGQNRASLAARGVQAGVGSARDIEATQEYQKQVDVYTMNINTVLAANAARQQSTQYKMQSIMLGGQAKGVSNMRGGMTEWAAPATSLLGSAGQLLSGYAQDYRNRAYFERMMGGGQA